MSMSAKILLAARYAANHGDWRSAENLYRQILNHDSENEDALNGIADALYFQGRLAEAEGDYRTAVFSKSYCPYCNRAKEALDKAGYLKTGAVVVELDLHAQGRRALVIRPSVSP